MRSGESGRTIGELLLEATERLAGRSESPRLDAETLLRHVTGLTATELIVNSMHPLEANPRRHFERALERRLHAEPVAYITGRREFWSLDFVVSPDTLIPRPETELLVSWALAEAPEGSRLSVVDLGTGSGCIAISIATERPSWAVLGVDVSSAALDIATRNARDHGLGNVAFRTSDWFDDLGTARFYMIVSNPPYVKVEDPHLDAAETSFEPQGALIAGADGLDAIRRIVADASSRLLPGGRLALEHGMDQAKSVRELLIQAGFDDVQTLRDLAGLERVTSGRRLN